jgi:hypothetical protein
MFYCQVTNRLSKSGEKVNKLVVATRERTYFQKFRNEETGEWEDVEVGHGWEIVKEIDASDEGARLFNAMTPEDRDLFCKELTS